jgi:high-affinity nickel permease
VPGTAVSGSFLFIVGLANTIILIRLLRRRRRVGVRSHVHSLLFHCLYHCPKVASQQQEDTETDVKHGMLMTRVLGPVINFVDRPYKACRWTCASLRMLIDSRWQMYVVGVLFGMSCEILCIVRF